MLAVAVGVIREGYPCVPEPNNPANGITEKTTFVDGPRIEAAFRSVVKRPSKATTHDVYDVVVCHGNVIRYFVMRALQVSRPQWRLPRITQKALRDTRRAGVGATHRLAHESPTAPTPRLSNDAVAT